MTSENEASVTPDVPCAEVRERVMADTLADLYRRWVEEGRPDRRG